MMSMIQFAAFTCFWMFSPESLVLVGNGSGYGSIQAGAFILFLTLIVFYGMSIVNKRERGLDEMVGAAPGRGDVILSALGGAGIVGTAVFASTGILVTAGFTFNEVFFYRFPNFGFAFLLLVAALVMQYFDVNRQRFILVLLVGIVVFCITLLVCYGLLVEVKEQPSSAMAMRSPVYLLLPLIFVFIGFEQTAHHLPDKKTAASIALVLVPSALLICGWMVVSAKFVSAERLAYSTIPHMNVAGKILEYGGRHIMGVAVICGSLAAVSTLFSISRAFLDRRKLIPVFSDTGREVSIFLAFAVALLMFSGVAGTSYLEHLIRTAFVMWTVYSGVLIIKLSFKKNKINAATVTGGISGGIVALLGLSSVLQYEKIVYFKLLSVFLFVSFLSVLLLEWLKGVRGKTATQKQSGR